MSLISVLANAMHARMSSEVDPIHWTRNSVFLMGGRAARETLPLISRGR
jgi:hypothetical protein